jgi:hypothetical protein
MLIPKATSLLSCLLLLGLGLSHSAQADEIGGTRVEAAKTVKGQVLRIEYENYVVQGKDGKEVRLHTDKTTQVMGQIKKGDRVEAKVDNQNHALSILSLP